MAEERVIKIGMLGLGTVGTGVYKVLKSQQEEMLPKLGARVELKKILVRNVEKAAAKVDDPSIITTSFEEIANDPEIEIVVEVMGGKQPAMNYILACLDAGKNVVTANKDLVASEGKKILATAKRNGKDFLYEASVAGGIPIIRPVKQCLAANHITELMGIFNGTTNFILTKMSQEGMEFGDALRLAQDMGYAEADPTADVEGLDAGRKVAILASAAFNSRVTFEDVYTEGITKITATDIEYAKEMGCTIKLLGVAKDTPEGIEARVHPMLIDSNHPLATVNDSYNAVFLTGDAVQDTMFYGRGAGELPTASAVVGDIFDVVRNILWNCCGRIGCTCYRECPIKRVGEIKSKYFVRMQIENRYGTLASVASVFGNNKVSIAQMLQKRVNGKYAEIVVITDEVKERHFEDAMQILGGMSMIQEISGDNPEKRAKHTQVIIDESDRLTSLVNDILNLSKIRSGMDSLKISNFNLSEFVHTVLERFDYLTETQGFSIERDIEDELYTEADLEKIEQVVYNLVGNAVNYTGEDKKIVVGLKRTEKGLRFTVTDTGKGIPPEEISTIWDRYYRSAETHKRPIKGTGLGLSIVKTILLKHGFDFGVESEVGKGSTFYVVFPDK